MLNFEGLQQGPNTLQFAFLPAQINELSFRVDIVSGYSRWRDSTSMRGDPAFSLVRAHLNVDEVD